MAVSLMSESWPELHISTLDYDRLEQLLSRLPLQHPSRQLLQQERFPCCVYQWREW